MPESQQHPEVSIIVPTYNERENLPLLVKRVGKSLKKVRGQRLEDGGKNLKLDYW